MSHFLGEKTFSLPNCRVEEYRINLFYSMIQSYDAPGKMYSFEKEIKKTIECARVTISFEPNSHCTIEYAANLNVSFF